MSGLVDLDALDGERRCASHRRLASVRADVHEMGGDTLAALAGCEDAARRTTTLPEQLTCRPSPNGFAAMSTNPPTASIIG